MKKKSRESRRRAILKQMAEIVRMERGRVSAEYRSNGAGIKPRGPYYKHQAWEKGRNVSRRVPLEQVEALEEAIQGYERFRELAEEYVKITVAMTRCK
jgi:hypothetical protein